MRVLSLIIMIFADLAQSQHKFKGMAVVNVPVVYDIPNHLTLQYGNKEDGKVYEGQIFTTISKENFGSHAAVGEAELSMQESIYEALEYEVEVTSAAIDLFAEHEDARYNLVFQVESRRKTLEDDIGGLAATNFAIELEGIEGNIIEKPARRAAKFVKLDPKEQGVRIIHPDALAEQYAEEDGMISNIDEETNEASTNSIFMMLGSIIIAAGLYITLEKMRKMNVELF